MFGDDLGADDGNVEHPGQFPQRMNVFIEQGLFQPKVVHAFQLAAEPDRVFEVEAAHRVRHQGEIGPHGIAHPAMDRNIFRQVLSAGMDLVRLEALVFHGHRFVGVGLDCWQYQRTAVGGHCLPAGPDEFIQRLAGILGGEQPQCDVERTVAVDRKEIPPAILGPERLPDRFPVPVIPTGQKRAHGRDRQFSGTASRTAGEAKGRCLGAIPGGQGNNQEFEPGLFGALAKGFC